MLFNRAHHIGRQRRNCWPLLVGGGRGYGFGSSGLRLGGGGGLIRMILVLLQVGSSWVIVSLCLLRDGLLADSSPLDPYRNVSS